MHELVIVILNCALGISVFVATRTRIATSESGASETRAIGLAAAAALPGSFLVLEVDARLLGLLNRDVILMALPTAAWNLGSVWLFILSFSRVPVWKSRPPFQASRLVFVAFWACTSILAIAAISIA